jgi:hypothetical protein
MQINVTNGKAGVDPNFALASGDIIAIHFCYEAA